jgi:hypothetical protein
MVKRVEKSTEVGVHRPGAQDNTYEEEPDSRHEPAFG